MKDKELEAYEYANARPNELIGTLDLWDRVQETNPFYTKKVNVKGNRLTSIAPQYQVHQATKEFGIYGETWGFKSLNFDYTLKDIGMIVLNAVFYYPKGEFPIINSVQLYRDGEMIKIDDNFAKKVETDTLTKALSKLGFNADIFMGRFDDTKYFAEMQEKYKEKPEIKPLPVLEENLFNLLLDSIGKPSKKWNCKVTVSEIEKRYKISKDYKDALELREEQTAPPIITDEEFKQATEAVEKGTATVAQIKGKYVLSTVQEKALELMQGLK